MKKNYHCAEAKAGNVFPSPEVAEGQSLSLLLLLLWRTGKRWRH